MTIISTPHAPAFAFNSVGQIGGRIDFGVHPDVEAVEFRLERVKPISQPADERPCPIPQRRSPAIGSPCE